MGDRERAIKRHPASDPLGLWGESMDADDKRSDSRGWPSALVVAFMCWSAGMMVVVLCIAVAGLMFG